MSCTQAPLWQQVALGAPCTHTALPAQGQPPWTHLLKASRAIACTCLSEKRWRTSRGCWAILRRWVNKWLTRRLPSFFTRACPVAAPPPARCHMQPVVIRQTGLVCTNKSAAQGKHHDPKTPGALLMQPWARRSPLTRHKPLQPSVSQTAGTPSGLYAFSGFLAI